MENFDFLQIPKENIVSISQGCKYGEYGEYSPSALVFRGTPIFIKNEIKKENKKESKRMKLLEIYERNKSINIEEKYSKRVEKLLEDDPLVKAAKEYNEQLNLWEDDEDKRMEYSLDFERILTMPNRNIKKKLLAEMNNEQRKVREMCYIVKSQLELADTFDQKQQILKSYKILDEDGTLNLTENNVTEKEPIIEKTIKEPQKKKCKLSK